MADTSPATTDLDWYVEAHGEDAEYAADSHATATQLVEDLIGEGNPYGVPATVVARAVLEVGADLYYRKASRNGVIGLEGVAPQPQRINRDPLAAAYPLLRRYLVMGL